MDVAAWLRGLGLGKYEAVFRDNDIRADVLPSLTADDLREIGVASVGDRRRLLDVIATLRGGPPPAAAPPPDAVEALAERRQITVLFCDLAGSTALSARLDPEDLRGVILAYHRTATEAVRQQDGYVAKLLGDGVLAYFGWPQAHEDDAERAVRAGLAAAEAVSRLEAPGTGPLAARVGIATGPVVVGEVLGEGEARERGVVGETPNLAARLQAVAEPGSVATDEATRRLTGTLFAWADLGAAKVKGLPRPVHAWRPLGESGVESRFEALRGHATPLVGRDEELELLLRRWRRAMSGEGQVVLLRGEAGIGKSRLTAALWDAVVSSGGKHEELVLYGSPQHAGSALHPVAAWLERVAGLAGADDPEARLARLEALLLPMSPPDEDVALVAELLSVPTFGRWPAPDFSPQRLRERLLQALARHLRVLASRRPVLAVVEDAHWLDPTTRELLDILVPEAPSLAVLVLVTHRPEFDAIAWLGQAHVTLVQMNRLSQAEHAALLRRVAGGKALPAEVEIEVLARTDGVPLFVEEVGRAVLESGVLREEADHWVLKEPLPQFAVPASLQASLVARLDRLSSAREVAQAGAVIGREFAHDLLSAVAGVPEPVLCAALEALTAADLVQRRGTPPEAVYAFRHQLIRDAAHDTLLRERRRDLHRRAADAIERLRPEAAEHGPEVLAQHRAAAGDAEAATSLYLLAGERAAARATFHEARAHLTRGLALLPGVEEEAAARRLEAGLQIALGNVALADEGYGSAESGRAFGRAVELCRGLARHAPLAQALAGLWGHTVHTGSLADALRIAEESVEVAGQWAAPGQRQRSRSLTALGTTLQLLGSSGPARRALDEAASADDAFEAGAVGVSVGAIAQPVLARLLACLGELELSASLASGAIERARQAGHLPSLGNALSVGCTQAWLVRDSALLKDREQELAEIAEAKGFAFWAARARGQAGWVAVEEGRVGEGIGLIAGCIASLRDAGTILHISHHEGMLSEANLIGGDTGAARAHVEEALRISARTGEAWFDADLHRRLGVVLLRLDPPEAARAESEFRRALEIARSQSAWLFALRAARDLARLLRDRGRATEARALLAPVYADFAEGFGFSDLVEARALLGELGAEKGSDDVTVLFR